MPPFKIAILGRPNVGKSSLMNALVGYRRSIVLDRPGTTLDEISESVKWEDIPLMLADTQGIFGEEHEEILRRALTRADAILLVMDAKSGLTPFDRWIAQLVLGARKPTLLVVNKVDGKLESPELEFSALRVSSMVAISAAHRRNLDAVKSWAVETAKKAGASEEKESDKVESLTVALVGRPNTGKSTLMNRLCSESVSRVSPLPLTTRDPISHDILTLEGQPIHLVDTAGIRRPRSKKADVESFSINAATRAIREADVVLLLVAANEPITDQDMRLLSLLEREGRPAAVLLNFWDCLGSKERKHFLEDSEFASYLGGFETLPISGLTGWNTERVLPLARKLSKRAKRRVRTSKLNRIVESIVAKNPPPAGGNQNFNILYASQVKVDPPTFVFFLNRKAALPLSYQRYVENQLRDRLGFRGQAIRVYFRGNER